MQTTPSAHSVPQSARSIFPQAPAFTLETFSSRDFSVKDFIEELSDSAFSSNRRSGLSNQAAFDPKPLIRSFEHALSRMSELSGDLEQRENELSAAVRRAEAHHASNTQTLGKKLDQTIDSFRQLDISLQSGDQNDDVNAVVKIGERLEKLDRQRTRALEAKFLIQCWMEVSERGELSLLEDIRRRGGGDGKVRCANIVTQLAKISQRLDPDSWSQVKNYPKLSKGIDEVNGVNRVHQDCQYNTREIIEKFSETLEKDLLKSFDDFYRKENFEGMRGCAKVLHDFNGGASVIGAFVNQHQFFIDRNQLITKDISDDSEIWERLADPDADPPGVEPSLQSLVDEVRIVVQEESIIIKRAFPYSEQVIGKFVQRIFQQSIQQRLEMVLAKANTISSLAFLRSLQAARSCISSLIDDLKAHGLTEHPETISPQISVILDQQFDDLFVPYFVGSSYIEREKRSLEEIYSSLLFKFTIFHSRKRKMPTTFMKSLAKSGSEILASARDAYVERLDSSDLAPAQKALLLRLAGLKDSDYARTQNDIEVSEEDGVLSSNVAKRMLKWLAEAVGRILDLSGGSETARDIYAMLNLLLNNMGEIYIEAALDAAVDLSVSQENAKNEPDLSYLSSLRQAFIIMNLMITCIKTMLIPLASPNISIRREIERATTLTMNRMEEKVNSIIQRTIDNTLLWVSKILATQRKNDFRPRDDVSGGSNAWLEMLQTSTCQSIFAFLGRIHALAISALAPSPNLISFLTEVAVGVRSLLLEHFKKFQVNAAGGLMITKDITKYIELLRSWQLGSNFEASLEVLTEVGNMFVIGPEALKERLRGKSPAIGGLWEKGDMKPYIQRREDAGSVGIQSVLSTL